MKKGVNSFLGISLILLSTSLIISCASPQDWFYKKSTFKGESLQTSSSLKPSKYTEQQLEDFTEFLKDFNTSSMMVLQSGEVVYEYGNTSAINYLASCRKSIMSMLYGKHVEDGTIDLNESIGDIGIDENDGLLAIEKTATVNDLITARSGVFHLPANGGYDTKNIKERGSVKPGEYFVYNNWDFNVAGYILEEKTGNTIHEELEQQLAIPLGFEDWNIKNQRKKFNKDNSQYPAFHFYLSTRDMAKVGQLMLNEGIWKDKQLISKDWIKKTTSPVSSVEIVNQRYNRTKQSPIQQSYSYMWWIYENFFDNPDFEGAYSASGWGGQFIVVIPKLDMVIAHKTKIDVLTYLDWAEHNVSEYQFHEIVRAFTDLEKETI